MERWEKLERKTAPAIAEDIQGPLSGIRVLLNGSVVAAPFAATMLSDFGAEVIALERPKVGGDTASCLLYTSDSHFQTGSGKIQRRAMD